MVLAACFFLFARRHFDFFSLGFLAALAYFLPGFYGYVLLPPTALSSIRERAELLPETYMVFVLVVLGIVVGARGYDLLAPRRLKPVTLPGEGLALLVLIVLALVGVLATVLTAGAEILSPRKHEVISAVGRWRILWVFSSSLGTVLAYRLRRWGPMAVLGACLLFDLYIGFRNNIALTMMTLFVLMIHRKGVHRLALRNFRLGFLGLFAALSMFGYKFLYAPIKRGDWDLVAQRLGDPAFAFDSMSRSEPFVTQAILNQVLLEKFRIGFAGFEAALYQLALSAQSFGVEIVTANEQFKEGLFPGSPGGVGTNIWAEMWSRGGWAMLLLFLAVYIGGLALSSHWLRLGSPLLTAFVALSGSYWAFYIHRNDLAFQLNLHKRLFLVWLLAVGGALIGNYLARRRGGGAHRSLGVASSPVVGEPSL